MKKFILFLAFAFFGCIASAQKVADLEKKSYTVEQKTVMAGVLLEKSGHNRNFSIGCAVISACFAVAPNYVNISKQNALYASSAFGVASFAFILRSNDLLISAGKKLR